MKRGERESKKNYKKGEVFDEMNTRNGAEASGQFLQHDSHSDDCQSERNVGRCSETIWTGEWTERKEGGERREKEKSEL